ncbi:MAG: sulfite exporter TauE/SafE family protein [Campylobacteraceae bacterium]|nr:sulfite exporter TauE/SafE family protein [Campylobacteraceae bacterium]
MELTLELILIFLTLGLVVGFMAGLLGIGGGGIMVPILTALFSYGGIEIEKAVPMALGTAMSSIVITSFSSMRAHKAKDNIIWSVWRPMSVGVILGVTAGTYLVSIANSIALALFFSIFMAYISVQLFLDKKPKPSRQTLPKPYLFGGGGFIGAISALVSIGGGSLTVPFLIWQNIDGKKAIGTSAALGFPLSVTGALCYMAISGAEQINIQTLTFGYVYLPAVFFISLASFFTAKLGAHGTQKYPVSVLKKILGALNMILAVKMLISVIEKV